MVITLHSSVECVYARYFPHGEIASQGQREDQHHGHAWQDARAVWHCTRGVRCGGQGGMQPSLFSAAQVHSKGNSRDPVSLQKLRKLAAAYATHRAAAHRAAASAAPEPSTAVDS